MMPNEVLPHRDFSNDEELWTMYDEIGKVIQKFVGDNIHILTAAIKYLSPEMVHEASSVSL